MLKAFIDLFRTKQQEKQPEVPVVKEPAEIKEPVVEIVPTPEPITVEAAVISEPVAIKDEIKVEVEKKPRGRPKSGKPKTKKK